VEVLLLTGERKEGPEIAMMFLSVFIDDSGADDSLPEKDDEDEERWEKSEDDEGASTS